MNRQAFAAEARRIEARYRGRTRALERSISRWEALGLATVIAWAAALAALGVAVLAAGAVAPPPAGPILVVVGAAVAIYGVFQASWLIPGPSPRPDGFPIARGDAPELWALLDRLRDSLDSRPFDEVRLTLTLNAGVYAGPRRGLLGRPPTILSIGLPLAQAMTPDEFAAVLAHEMGHHLGRHAEASARLRRLERTWGEAARRIEQPAAGVAARASRAAVARFVMWYWPRVRVRDLALSRMHEHRADLDAAEVVGGPALAHALWRLEILSPRLDDEAWPAILAEAADRPEPPDDVADRLAAAIQAPPPHDAAARVTRALARATLPDETHPALADRLGPLGLGPDDLGRIGLPARAEPSAADVYLGDAAPAAGRALSQSWRDEALGPWRERRRLALAEAARRAGPAPPTPAGSAPEGPAPDDARVLWEAACRASQVQGPDAAAPLFRRVLEAEPGHAGAAVVVGGRLALDGDPQGEAMLRRVLDGDDEAWIAPAGQALCNAYRALGRADDLRDVEARLDRHEAEIAAARRERASVRASDRFIDHGLDAGALAALVDRLAADQQLDAAWLVRKDVAHFPRRRLFVLVVRATGPRWRSGREERGAALVRRIAPRADLPGQALVIAPDGPFASLAKACMKRPDAQVFRRAAPS